MQDSKVNFKEKLESIFSHSSFTKYLQLDYEINDILKLEKNEVEKRLFKALEGLRRTQKWYYFNILDELILKGFDICDSFEVSERSNTTSYIRVHEDSSRYEKVHWSKLGLEDVNEYFDIRSDYFFNYLEPERFKHFNKELSSEKIINFFKEYGFIVERIDVGREPLPREIEGDQEVKDIEEGRLEETKEERLLGEEEVSFLESEILQNQELFVEKEYLQKKYNIDISKYLRDKLVVTADKVAHIDRINISLSEECALISEKNDIYDMEFLIIEKRYTEIIRKNREVDSKEKIVSIIKILER